MWVEVYDYAMADDASPVFTNLDHVVSIKFRDGRCSLYGANNTFLGKAVRPAEVLAALHPHTATQGADT